MAKGFDDGPRRAIFDALYAHWRTHAFAPMPLADLEARVDGHAGSIVPHLYYLMERGGVAFESDVHNGKPKGVRLTATGIDTYEERVLLKAA
jgi:hypothetical protein